MTGSGRVGDQLLGEHWERSLVGVTGTPQALVRRRRGWLAERLARAYRRHLHRTADGGAGSADSNRLHTPRRARRRFVAPAIVLGAGLAGSTAVLAFSPVKAEHVPLVCPAGVTVGWVDQYRDVLGLRLPDPRDHLEVVAPAGSTVAVTVTDGTGAAYPTVRETVPAAGTLAVEPPRAIPASERGTWSMTAVVSADGVSVARCDAPLP
ncbi:hypothetical protein GCM10010413_20580 [Promicromonospora sukumoe]|uniref:Uncharacterized protein n=1 Tax=Promicromonospora sukumoe TaxID=88382 RepID=A0A7W3PE63_9MICO|nr:hypothetical protein [Promicromonospora sukumoe]MBA8808725.1 hypothetical protein [Promicromonospora sukumoe]